MTKPFEFEAFNAPCVHDCEVFVVAFHIAAGNDVEAFKIPIGDELNEQQALELATFLQEAANERVAALKKEGRLL